MAENDPPDPTDRPDWFAHINTTWGRITGALLVVLLAALVAPILTSEPNRDETALETANERDKTGVTVNLDEETVDAGVEAPADGTDGDDAADDDVDKNNDDDETASKTTKPGSSTDGGPTSTVAGDRSTTSTTVQGAVTTSTVAPTTTETPPDCKSDAAAVSVITSSLNAERSSRELPALSRSGAIDDVAQRWACRMAADGMRHNPDYVSQVFAVCGGCTAVAENVGNNPTASGAWSAWMASAGHFKNITADRTGKHGVGAARSSSGQLFVVHNFAWD